MAKIFIEKGGRKLKRLSVFQKCRLNIDVLCAYQKQRRGEIIENNEQIKYVNLNKAAHPLVFYTIKSKQGEHNKKKCGTWGALNPTTRKPQNPKAYSIKRLNRGKMIFGLLSLLLSQLFRF